MTGTSEARPPLHFRENDLRSLTADVLKPMSRTWGGKGTEAKEVCIRRILDGVASESAVRAVLSGRSPEDRAALALLKATGGVLRVGTLEATLLAYGYQVAPEPDRGYGFGEGSRYAAGLVRRGLALVVRRQEPYAYYGSGTSHGVNRDEFLYSDERLLCQVDWPVAVRALALDPASPPPAASTFRRRQHVMLDLLAVTRTFGEMRSFALTKTGAIRVAEERQFLKRMDWRQTQVFDGHRFPGLAGAIFDAWRQLGLLRPSGDPLTFVAAPERFARLSLPDQVRALMQAFLDGVPWCEVQGDGGWPSSDDMRSLRGAVLRGLQALPDRECFYHLDDFVAALYDRVGTTVASRRQYRPLKPVRFHQMSAEDHRAAVEAWEQECRAQWVEREKTAVTAILTTWLYWLGTVQIGEIAPHRLAFRLTALGRECLVMREEAVPGAAEEETPAWVVQPNYDVIAYLDAASPEQLAFLEQHAQRRQMEAHTAHYLLTSESIYRGLEGGSTLETVLAALRRGAHADLPQNVEREIREWARQRELLVIHTRARLVAFPSAEDRARAIQAGLPGKAAGDVYLLMDAGAPAGPVARAASGLASAPIIDYAQTPRQCLHAEEDGTLTLVGRTDDLLLRGQLARCAEPVDDTRWRITKASLAGVHAAGTAAGTLLAFLESRLAEPIPQLLECTIRNALGTRPVVQAGAVLAVRIADKALYSAIISSSLTRPYLLDVPGPDTVIVAPEKRDEFLVLLEQLSVRLTALDRVEERPDWRQTVKDARSQQRRRRRY